MNRKVGPRVPQHAKTMASRLRDFTIMSPPMFFGSSSNEDPQDILDKVYKILHAMGVTTIKKSKLVAYKLKYVSLTWHVEWRDNRELNKGMRLPSMLHSWFLTQGMR